MTDGGSEASRVNPSPPPYQIAYANRHVERQVATLPATVQRRVTRAISSLSSDPRPPGVRKLAGGLEGAWRIRVGDYRVLYDIDDGAQVVNVLAVVHRRDAYR